MTDALSLDAATIDAQLAGPRARVYESPWHARRALGFGASDVPALLVGLGLHSVEDTPRHIAANAAPVRVAAGGSALGAGVIVVPRIVAEKAGIKRPLAAGRAAAIGTAREGELLRAWRDSLGPESPYDPESVGHMSALPRELHAGQRDIASPMLAASYDGWCRDVFGGLLVVELKCGHLERDSLPWYWRAQVQAQLACSGLSRGVLVLGQRWARGDDDGPIVSWLVERDEIAIAEIRDAVSRAWAMVDLIMER